VALRLDADGAALRFVLVEPPPGDAMVASRPATIDVGEAGHLVGLEIDLDAGETLYLEVEPDASVHARSAATTATVFTAPGGETVAVEVPRRGHGYEVTYPVGNR